jgi:hypothetical protein
LDLFIWLLRGSGVTSGLVLLSLDAPVPGSGDTVDLHGRVVLFFDGLAVLHLSPGADYILLFIVHLIVNFFNVVVEAIIDVLLFIVFLDTYGRSTLKE